MVEAGTVQAVMQMIVCCGSRREGMMEGASLAILVLDMGR